ncbi:MAG TPA: hypothetical protein PLK28_06860 [Candidatus Rifleibacterium sp.]|nr:hypothetical protein [Candidatus Rifleibacterium sp.]
MTRFIFSLGIFVGSFLLFLIQPMVGKILLPGFGGVPAVWTTCMLFFQAALLAGYIYAERSISLLGFRRQSLLHLILLLCGIFFLPLDIDLSDIHNAVHQPTFWLFSQLTVSIGYLFFLIAANAPLLQRYYSYSGQDDAVDPYFLYSASNAGGHHAYRYRYRLGPAAVDFSAVDLPYFVHSRFCQKPGMARNQMGTPPASRHHSQHHCLSLSCL